MTVEIKLNGSQLEINDQDEVIVGRCASQLNFWKFYYDDIARTFISSSPTEISSTLAKVVGYLARQKIHYTLTEELAELQASSVRNKAQLQEALQAGALFKSGDLEVEEQAAFLEFIKTRVPRKLKPHQIKAALHLLAVKNGANFSVPGSGKTSVTICVFSWLRHKGEVDALFVVGPPACFAPWQTEYEAVLGVPPSTSILAGGDIIERQREYLIGRSQAKDLYLTSFQTLQNDSGQVSRWFKASRISFYFVVDEAHYIKQLDGAWATAVLNVSQNTPKKCVLSGTPFPRSYSDAFNLFDLLWPTSPPISADDKTRITLCSQRKRDDEAAALLDRAIGPLFYRVRKQDLGLAAQQLHSPLIVKMKKFERIAFDALLQSVRSLSKKDHSRNFETLERLRRGRMMRLRQSVSYAKLLGTAVADYPENPLQEDMSLADIIRHYDELESPGKLTTLMELVQKLRQQGEKIVIWSNFITTLKLIVQSLRAAKYRVQLIYGDTPTEECGVQDELTRSQIIADFQSLQGSTDILVANPAACAESISLHKSCSNAIYYDLSYNCAQYLQSLDRIHRVGGSEEKESNYYFLQYGDTIDDDILTNVRRKADRMSRIIDQEYPIYSLDMFSGDDELEAYDRLFRSS